MLAEGAGLNRARGGRDGYPPYLVSKKRERCVTEIAKLRGVTEILRLTTQNDSENGVREIHAIRLR